MKIFWLFLLIPICCHATVTNWYRGEASPGQLNDSVGSTSLTMVGTVTNPSSPAPSDGLLWLAGGFSDANYFTLPGSVIPTGGTGSIEWYANIQNATNATEAFWVMNNGASFGTLGTRYFEINSPNLSSTTFKITGDYTDSSGTNNHFDSGGTAVLTAGTTYTIRVQWDGTGVNVFVGGVSVVTNSAIPNFGSPTQMILGRPGHASGDSSPHYMDALAIGTSSSDPFPPTTNKKAVSAAASVNGASNVQGASAVQNAGVSQ